MSEEMYLLDNNALSHLSRAQRSSAFFAERCRIPTEVLHEAAGYPDSANFKQIEYPTTARVLEVLVQIMSTVQPTDTKLVNLYANKGAADPLLIACALHGSEEASALLWGPTWIVVSNDKAVQAKCAEYGVETRSREQFLAETSCAWGI